MNYPSGFPGTAAVQNTAFIDQSCTSTWNAPPNMPPAWEPASYVNSTVSIVTARLPLCAPLQKPSQCMPVCPLSIACTFLVIPSSSLMYVFGAGVGSTAFSQLLVRVVTQLCLLNGKIDHFFFFLPENWCKSFYIWKNILDLCSLPRLFPIKINLSRWG